MPTRWPTATLLALLAVHLLLALCAYPALDDWVFAAAGRDHGVAISLSTYYHDWGGRWASGIALYGLGLLPSLAWCYPLLVLAGFAGAAWGLGRIAGWRGALLAGVPLLAWLPSPAEGPYWMSGGVTYLLPVLLLLPVAALAAGRGSAVLRMLAGTAAGGCSETAAVLVGAGLLAACLLHDRRHAWTLVGASAGALVLLLAPGNQARWEHIAGPARPDLAAACLAALPASLTQLGALLRDALLSPVTVALAALAVQLPRSAPAPRGWPSGLAMAALLGAAGAALLASNATVGFIEGRQANVIWLHAVLSLGLGAWLLLARRVARQRDAALLAWWAAAWIAVALRDADGVGVLLCTLAACAGAAWVGWRSWRLGLIVPAAWLAVAALGAPLLPTACGDLARAPLRRIEQAERDTTVVRLRDAGARAVRVPLLTPEYRAQTISVGDLQTGHWATAGYAAYHGLERVVVDPRVRATSALDQP